MYVDGTFYPSAEAKISVFDHGLLYGDGVFEGICIYDGRIFRLKQHLRRLYESAKTIQLRVPLSVEEFEAAIVETVRRNSLRDGYVRPIVTRGAGKLGLDPSNCRQATVVVIPQRLEDYPLMAARRKPARAIVSTMRRNPTFSIPASAKSLNYLNNILAKLQATYAGVDEAIMLDWRGLVSEGTGDNLFIVQQGSVFTPPEQSSVLRGVTRDAILEIARGLGIPAEERELTLHDLYNADEAFLTSTSVEIQPLVEVDGRMIGTGVEGPYTRRIRERFDEIKRTEGTPVL